MDNIKLTGLAAIMAGATAKNQAEANKLKARILKAGIPGIMLPDDFDSLSEDEKQKRLDKAIEVARGKP
jgi:dihydrodipicolinate synthase/N-acetylneuraminate lyase